MGDGVGEGKIEMGGIFWDPGEGGYREGLRDGTVLGEIGFAFSDGVNFGGEYQTRVFYILGMDLCQLSEQQGEIIAKGLSISSVPLKPRREDPQGQRKHRLIIKNPYILYFITSLYTDPPLIYTPPIPSSIIHLIPYPTKEILPPLLPPSTYNLQSPPT